MKLYPIADRLTSADWSALGLADLSFSERGKRFGSVVPSLGTTYRNLSAIYAGEKRCPKAGEWYLSGAIVEAYRAPNDLSTPYHIARLVLTETREVTTIV